MGKCRRRDIRVVKNCWGRCEKVGERCRKACGHPTLFYVSPTLFHSSPHLNTLSYTLHTNLIHSSTPLPPSNTLPHFFHIPPYLTPLPKLPKIPNFSTIHTPPNSPHSPYSFPYSLILTLSFTPY